MVPSLPNERSINLVGTAGIVAEKFASTLFLPALPAIAIGFSMERDHAQQFVAVFLVGVCLSQLLWGYWSDYLGHRRTLICLLPAYAASALMTAFAGGIALLFSGVFLQGFFIGAVTSITQALVGERVGEARTARSIAWIGMLGSSAVVVGATLGSFLVHHYSWRAPFTALAVLVLATSVLYLRLPADTTTKSQSAGLTQLFTTYATFLRHRPYLHYAISVTILNVGLFAFWTLSPFLLIQDLGINPRWYGPMLLLPIGGFAVGRLLCMRWTNSKNRREMIAIGASISILGGLLMAGAQFLFGLDQWTLLASMAVYLLGMGIAAPNARTGAIHSIPGRIAAGSSLMSVLIYGVGSLGSNLAGHLPDHSITAFVLGSAVLNAAWLLASRPKQSLRAN